VRVRTSLDWDQGIRGLLEEGERRLLSVFRKYESDSDTAHDRNHKRNAYSSQQRQECPLGRGKHPISAADQPELPPAVPVGTRYGGNVSRSYIDIECPGREHPYPQPRRHGPLDGFVAPELHLVGGCEPNGPHAAENGLPGGGTWLSQYKDLTCEIRQVKASSIGKGVVCRGKQLEPILKDRPNEKGWVVFPAANDAEPQEALANVVEDVFTVAEPHLELHRGVGATKATEDGGEPRLGNGRARPDDKPAAVQPLEIGQRLAKLVDQSEDAPGIGRGQFAGGSRAHPPPAALHQRGRVEALQIPDVD